MRFLVNLTVGLCLFFVAVSGVAQSAADKVEHQELLQAAENGDGDRLRVLLEQPDVDVNARTTTGATALILAAAKGHIWIVQALLAAGADVNAEERTGITALMAADLNGRREIVEMLLAAGAKPRSAAQTESKSDKQTDIRKLIEVTGAANLENLKDLFWAGAEQQVANLPQDFRDKVWSEFLKEARVDDLVNRLIPTYERHLTHEDIKEMVAFYESEVGKRVVAAQPKILAEQIPATTQWSMETAQRTFSKLFYYLQAVELHHSQGKLDEAIAAYRQVISLYPNDPDFHWALAQALKDAGREEEAQQEFSEAKRLGHESVSADQQPLEESTQDASDSLAWPQAVRVGGNVKPPRKIKDVNPHYPDLAKQAGIQGIVILEAIIDPEGKVDKVRVLHSIPGLDQAAIDAVRQWEYEPTLLEGLAVPLVMTVTVNFALQSPPKQ
jgi:TonB family protein